MGDPASPFRFERDLVDILCESAVDELGTPHHDSGALMREVPVGACTTRIPDVVLVFSKSPMESAPIPLTYYDATLLAALLNRPATAAELSLTCFAQSDDVDRRLRKLRTLSLVVESDNGRYKVNAGVLPGNVRIVAIEAKLSRWREALAQAQHYHVFANEAYIALPAAMVNRLDVLDACANAGVGVIAVDGAGSRVVLDAESIQPQTPEWFRFVSTAIGINQRSQARTHLAKVADD